MSTPDRIYRVCTADAGAVIENLSVDPKADGQSADQFEDIYKFSDKHGVTHRHLWVLASGSKENAIDINNRCADLLFEDTAVLGGQQSGVLVKGGCSDITLRRVVFGDCGPRCEVLLGDWSDQSNDKTTGILLDGLVRTSEQPVRVIVGHADWPRIVGGNVKILYFQSYLQKAYWWIKFATRKLFGGKLAFLMPCLVLGLMLSGCSLFKFGSKATIDGGGLLAGGQAAAPKDNGKPAIVTSEGGESKLPLPAGSTIVITKTDAQPATETAPAKPAFETREIKLSADTAWTEKTQAVTATTGTIDTSVAMHKADVAERRWLLWTAIACGVGGLFLRQLMPTWPGLSNGLLIGAPIAFAAWKFSEIPAWLSGVGILVCGLVALGYKRAEWDKDKDGIPDFLEKKTASTSTN